jgi:hypothetical protein
MREDASLLEYTDRVRHELFGLLQRVVVLVPVLWIDSEACWEAIVKGIEGFPGRGEVGSMILSIHFNLSILPLSRCQRVVGSSPQCPLVGHSAELDAILGVIVLGFEALVGHSSTCGAAHLSGFNSVARWCVTSSAGNIAWLIARANSALQRC